jgi:hypothetical protein
MMFCLKSFLNSSICLTFLHRDSMPAACSFLLRSSRPVADLSFPSKRSCVIRKNRRNGCNLIFSLENCQNKTRKREYHLFLSNLLSMSHIQAMDSFRTSNEPFVHIESTGSWPYQEVIWIICYQNSIFIFIPCSP